MEKRRYELTVLLESGTTQKQIEELIAGLLKKSGGKVVKFDFWGKKQLVYPIKKQNQAVYGFFELEMTGKEVVELRKRIVMEDDLMRNLIVVKNERIKKDK